MKLFAKGKGGPGASAAAPPSFQPIERSSLLAFLDQLVNSGQSGLLEIQEPRGAWAYAFQAGALTHASGGRVRGARQAFDLLWEFQQGEYRYTAGTNHGLGSNLYIDKARLQDLLRRSQASLQSPGSPYIPADQQRPIAPVSGFPGQPQGTWGPPPQSPMPAQGASWPPAGYPQRAPAGYPQQAPTGYPQQAPAGYPPQAPAGYPAPMNYPQQGQGPGYQPGNGGNAAPIGYPPPFAPQANPAAAQGYPPQQQGSPQYAQPQGQPGQPVYPGAYPAAGPQGSPVAAQPPVPAPAAAPARPVAPPRPVTPPSFSVPPMPIPRKQEVYQPPAAQVPAPIAPPAEPAKTAQTDDLQSLRASLVAQAPAAAAPPAVTWNVRTADGTVAPPPSAKTAAAGKNGQKKPGRLRGAIDLQLIKFLLWACERRYSPDEHWTLKDAFEVSTMELRDQFVGAFSQSFKPTAKGGQIDDDVDEMAAGRMRGRAKSRKR